MMTIRWTPTASDDLESVYDYLAQDNPGRAHLMIQRIVSAIETLTRHPGVGRKGLILGTRELIIIPYVVVYRIRDQVVEILNIIHSARRWRGPL